MGDITRRKYFGYANLWAVLPFVLLVPSLVWIWQDHSIWWSDKAEYARNTITLYNELIHHRLGWFSSMLSATPKKAPGIVWFGQFFVVLHKLFGSVERALLFYVLLTQGLTVWIIYDTWRRLSGAREVVGTACALFAAGAPLFVGLSHQFLAEPLQLLVIAWLWRLAVASPDISRYDLVIMEGIALTLGMVAKTSTPLYAAPPIVIAALGSAGLLRPRPECPRSLRPFTRIFLLVSLTLGMVMVAAWYVRNFRSWFGHIVASSSSEMAAFWGSTDPFVTKFWRWLDAFRLSFLPGLMLYVVTAALAFGLWRAFRSRRHEIFSVVLALGGLVSVGVTIVLFSLARNEETRYLVSLLPAVAAILAWGIGRAGRSLALIFTLFALGSGLAVQGAALGVLSYSPKYSVWVRNTPFLNLTPSSELAALVKYINDHETESRNHLCAVEYGWLDHDVLSFYDSKERLRNRLSGPKPYFWCLYCADDLDNAMDFVKKVKPGFIISVREELQPPPNFFNRMNLPFLARIRTDPHYEQVEFPSQKGVILFKRRKDINRNPGANL